MMTITPLQFKIARTALSWSVRDLAQKAEVSPDSITRAERGEIGISRNILGAIQRALETAGIEFLPEQNSVSLHADPIEAAIVADPAMPLTNRRQYPRSVAEAQGSFIVSIVRLPLPTAPLNQTSGNAPHDITPRRFHNTVEALEHCRALITKGYGVEITGPNLRWDRAEILRQLSADTA